MTLHHRKDVNAKFCTISWRGQFKFWLSSWIWLVDSMTTHVSFCCFNVLLQAQNSIHTSIGFLRTFGTCPGTSHQNPLQKLNHFLAFMDKKLHSKSWQKSKNPILEVFWEFLPKMTFPPEKLGFKSLFTLTKPWLHVQYLEKYDQPFRRKRS